MAFLAQAISVPPVAQRQARGQLTRLQLDVAGAEVINRLEGVDVRGQLLRYPLTAAHQVKHHLADLYQLLACLQGIRPQGPVAVKLDSLQG